MKTPIKIILAVALSSSLFYALPTNAARLSLLKDKTMVHKGEQFEVVLKLDTEGQSINALETVIEFSSNLSLDGISDANSAVSLWLKTPNINESNQTKSAEFSGIIPGGIKHSSVAILALRLSGIREGGAYLRVKNAEAYLNDAEGTAGQVSKSSLDFTVSDAAPNQFFQKPLILDFSLPEKFEIFLTSSEQIFESKWFISFNTQDKGSGISHYEVREKLFGIWGQWHQSSSPYKLRYQSLFSIIEVKAVDNNGLERVAVLIPERFYIFCIILGGLLVLLVWFLVRTRWQKVLNFFKH